MGKFDELIIKAKDLAGKLKIHLNDVGNTLGKGKLWNRNEQAPSYWLVERVGE